jgi:translation initiation factor IF-1
MAKKEKNIVVTEGIIKECLPDTRFLVEIDVNGTKHEIIGYLSGKMRMHYIWLAIGDKVMLEISPYDPTVGRITYRNK